jgi:hypothetical protein
MGHQRCEVALLHMINEMLKTAIARCCTQFTLSLTEKCAPGPPKFRSKFARVFAQISLKNRRISIEIFAWPTETKPENFSIFF